MDRLIFTAMSGLTESMVQQRVIASNMANAQTTGFHAEMLATTPVTLQGPALQARAMVQSDVHGADMRAGTFSATGNPLDIAVNGNDLIAVSAPDGSEAYTRRGDLSVSASGVLQNGEGLAVIGQGGPITVPVGSAVSISPDGSVLVASTQAGQPPQPVDKIKLANPDGTKIEKNLDGLFVVQGDGYFQVAMPGGQMAYTRAGNFTLSAQGQIVTAQGYVVQPPITVPPGSASITIAPDGSVSAIAPGSSTPTTLGQMQIASFTNGSALQASSDNFLMETAASGPVQLGAPGQNGTGSLSQGMLETSNVNITNELVDMIECQRAYEINSKMISSVDDMLKNANQTL